MYNIIKKNFCKKFASAENALDENELFVGNKKTMSVRDWLVKWVIQENEKGTYMEYYAIHDTREHLHERIYGDGNEEKLEVLKQYIVYSPNVPGDRERSTRDFETHNRRLIYELKQKGLM